MNVKSFIPILDWLPQYEKSWLKNDLTAGLTIGIMLIPQGIAYAMIAGLPPIYGLYTAIVPQLVYAVFGTSRQLSVGPVAMDSLIVAAGVTSLAVMGTDRFIEFSILLALLTGAFQFIFGLVKLGFLVNFLSKPVISGFTSGAALIIGLNQLKHLLGVDIARNNQIQLLIIDTFKHLAEINWITCVISLLSILFLVLMKKYFRQIPASLLLVIIGTFAVYSLHLDQYGVQIVGEIPSGLPHFKIPFIDKDTFLELMPIALTLSFIAFLEAISVAKSIEAKHDNYKVKPNQELIALGLGNMIGSLFQTYPATGGFSRTAVNDHAHAKTPLAAIFSALVVLITLLFLTPYFYFLPKAILGAVIVVAVFGLLDFSMPGHLLKYSKRDLLILNATLIITATIGIKEGILTGVLLSLIMLIYKSTKPHIAILGKVPGTHFYRNKKRFSEVEIENELLIVRFDAQLHFANTAYFKDKLQEFASAKGEKLKIVIIDGESLNNLDSSGIYGLTEILDYFHRRHIAVYFTGLKGPVRDTINNSGLIKIIGTVHCFMSIQEAVDYYKSLRSHGGTDRKHQNYIDQTS
jgi:SulP family sulfate permease